MKHYDIAPPLPGTGNAHNLVPGPVGMESCPCCGAVWKGGRPWAEAVLSPVEMAERTGQSPQTITQRIRNGSIAAYLAAGAGGRNKYLIPVFEFERVAALEPSKAGRPSQKAQQVEDLGVKRG